MEKKFLDNFYFIKFIFYFTVKHFLLLFRNIQQQQQINFIS